MQKDGYQLPMHRSRSVPVLNKEGIVKQMDYLGSVYRVIPATPKVTEQASTTPVPGETTTGAGTYCVKCLRKIIFS